MAVASRQASQAAREIQDVLQERDVRGLGIVAGSTAGGVVVAQEVADRVLPAIGMSREPTDATGFAASAGVKTVTALGFGALATRLSGTPLVVSAWMGAGALAGAGADLFNAIQRTGFLAEAPGAAQVSDHATAGQSGGATNTSSASTNSTSPSPSTSPSTNGGSQAADISV